MKTAALTSFFCAKVLQGGGYSEGVALLMGARGPKPKPSQLRKAQGNPGRKKISKNEPKPAIAVPYCPNHLTLRAKQEWKRVAPLLAKLGLLTKLDRGALAAYCQAYATWAKACCKVKRQGELILTTNGNLQQNPWIWIANRALDQMNKYISEFGLSPASRSRIEIDRDLLTLLHTKKYKPGAFPKEVDPTSTVDDLLKDMDGANLPGGPPGQA